MPRNGVKLLRSDLSACRTYDASWSSSSGYYELPPLTFVANSKRLSNKLEIIAASQMAELPTSSCHLPRCTWLLSLSSSRINKTRLALLRHNIVYLRDLRGFCIGTVALARHQPSDRQYCPRALWPCRSSHALKKTDSSNASTSICCLFAALKDVQKH